MTVLLLGLVGAFAIRPVWYPAARSVEEIRDRIADTGRIVHAGGFLETEGGERVAYSNSYDALVNMYAHGNRVCEIDIRKTVDGLLICAHGDNDILANGTELPVTATGEEFLAVQLYGEFQPMTVDMLADFMREHEDLLIITDIRLENEAICRELSIRYPDLQNRFIVQIYHEEEYNRIRELGFENLIYTLYQAYDDEWNLWRIAHFAEENELIGITMPRSQFFDVKKRLAMAHCGLPVMFHTVDDPEEISNMLQKPYVYGAYTDLIN